MKSKKEIMVVKRKVLFEKNYFQGFKNHDEFNFESIIINNYIFMERNIAERDINFKQPIAYCLIVNPKSKKVFVYQRSKKTSETRLHENFSLGIGGHIDKIDSLNGNPIITSLLRELKEEININENINPKIIGYINDDSNSVGQVHFGIVYLIETDLIEIDAKDDEIKQGKLISFKELEELINSKNFETWSKICFDNLKEKFKE